MSGDRLTHVDFRIGKNLRYGRTRTLISKGEGTQVDPRTRPKRPGAGLLLPAYSNPPPLRLPAFVKSSTVAVKKSTVIRFRKAQ
jgi:hypothetical protein